MTDLEAAAPPLYPQRARVQPPDRTAQGSLPEKLLLPAQIVSLPDQLKNADLPLTLPATLSLVSHSFLKDKGQLLVLNTPSGILSLDFSWQDFIQRGGLVPEGKSWETVLKDMIVGKIPLTCELLSGQPTRCATLGVPLALWKIPPQMALKTLTIPLEKERRDGAVQLEPRPSFSGPLLSGRSLGGMAQGMVLDCARLPVTSWRVLGGADERDSVALTSQADYTQALNRHPLRHEILPPRAPQPEKVLGHNEALPEEKFLISSLVVDPDALAPDILGAQRIAHVIGKTALGQALIALDQTVYIVRTPVSAPQGMHLILTSVSKEETTEDPAPILRQQYETSADKIASILGQLEQTPVLKTLTPLFPHANEKLPSTLLLFFHALARGQMGEWVTQTIKTDPRETNKNESQRLLHEAFESPQPIFQDKDVGTWTMIHVPLCDGHSIQMLELYVHREGTEKNDSHGKRDKNLPTRFILNVALSRLGNLQIDGLVRTKNLDLIVRTEKALPLALPAELRTVYIQSLDALEFKGSLVFQTGREGWLSLRPVGEEEAFPCLGKTV